MAEGGNQTPNPFSLLPSDIKDIKNAAEYVKTRGNELKELSTRVKKRWFFGHFWDSKVANKDRGWFNVSFSCSDPKEIEKEIKSCLQLFVDVLKALDKVDDEKKTETEREMPYLIIINLNFELVKLFETARIKIQSTTSKSVERMYNEFLGRRKEMEDKMKLMENVFLKQQCSAMSKSHEDFKNNTEKACKEAMRHKEESLKNLKEEMDNIKEENTNFQNTIKTYDKTIEDLMKRLETLELETCKKCKRPKKNCVCNP